MMKNGLYILLALSLASCTKTTPTQKSLEERLHGNWYGVEITNHLIAQGLWDTLHPHSISHLTATFDTLNGTFVVDSSGVVLDSAQMTVGADSSITILGAVNAVDWSFDRTLINAFGQPILQQLESSFTGNQKSKIIYISDSELHMYFEKVIPVSYQGFQANMELRHTEYWTR